MRKPCSHSPTPLRGASAHRRESSVGSGWKQRLAAWCGLGLWLLASGAHWDLAQLYAWTTMTMENAQSLSLEEAIEQTFSPEGKCSVCVAIQAGRKQESDEQNAIPGLGDKAFLVFIHTETTQAPPPPPALSHKLREVFPGSILKGTPPVPPPRVS